MDSGIHRAPAPGPPWLGAMDSGIHRAPAPVLARLGAMDPGIQQGNRVWVRVSIAASGRAGAMDPGIYRSCGSPPGARRQHPGTAGKPRASRSAATWPRQHEPRRPGPARPASRAGPLPPRTPHQWSANPDAPSFANPSLVGLAVALVGLVGLVGLVAGKVGDVELWLAAD